MHYLVPKLIWKAQLQTYAAHVARRRGLGSADVRGAGVEAQLTLEVEKVQTGRMQVVLGGFCTLGAHVSTALALPADVLALLEGR